LGAVITVKLGGTLLSIKLCVPVKLEDFLEVTQTLEELGVRWMLYPSTIEGYQFVLVIPAESKKEAFRLRNCIAKSQYTTLYVFEDPEPAIVEKYRLRWRLVRSPIILNSDKVRDIVDAFKEHITEYRGYKGGADDLLGDWDTWLKEADNWSKSYLSHVVFCKLHSKLFPGYTILACELWRPLLISFLEDFSSERNNECHLTQEDKIFILYGGASFDFVGCKTDGERVVDKCFIELKSVCFRSFRVNRSPSLSRSQRQAVPKAIHRGFNVYLVMLVYLPGRRIKVLVYKAFIKRRG